MSHKFILSREDGEGSADYMRGSVAAGCFAPLSIKWRSQ